ncbi:MAG TPA: hypothetical protein V6C65_22230 [Allocoleopsis sp.]
MDSDYFGIRVVSVLIRDRWKWQVTLPIGATVTSNEGYPTPEQAVEQGKHWIGAESIFDSVNICLTELCEQGKLQQREYSDLMQSLATITRRVG